MKTVHLQPNLIQQGLEISMQLVPNNRTAPHKHSHYEIFYILSGEIEHDLNGKEEVLSMGDCILMTPTDVHSLYCKGESLHRDLLISESLFEDALALVTRSKSDIPTVLSKRDKPLHFNSTEIVELENLASAFTNSTDLYKKRCTGLSILLKILNKLLEAAEPVASDSLPLVERVLDYLNKSPSLKGGIPTLTRALQYSPSYICHAFKKQTGIALSQYIKDLRLNHCAYYLKTTNYSLRKIADLIGIESLSYLNKIFKEKHGISPIKYRKKYKAEYTTEDD